MEWLRVGAVQKGFHTSLRWAPAQRGANPAATAAILQAARVDEADTDFSSRQLIEAGADDIPLPEAVGFEASPAAADKPSTGASTSPLIAPFPPEFNPALPALSAADRCEL
eukprot:6182380-Pleurochrysis_carterae.AAC.2